MWYLPAYHITYITWSNTHHLTLLSRCDTGGYEKHLSRFILELKCLRYASLYSDAYLRHLVQTLHHLGLLMSYECVRVLKIAVARSVCKRIEDDGMVLSINMHSVVFTTGDFDNLDHKKTHNLSNDEFHGVAISLTNHLSQETMGLTRETVTIDPQIRPCQSSQTVM